VKSASGLYGCGFIGTKSEVLQHKTNTLNATYSFAVVSFQFEIVYEVSFELLQKPTSTTIEISEVKVYDEKEGAARDGSWA
jgi:hypothetical protein